MADGKSSLQLKTSLLVHDSVRNKIIITVTTYLMTDRWDMQTPSFSVVLKGDSHVCWVRQGCKPWFVIGSYGQSDCHLAPADRP